MSQFWILFLRSFNFWEEIGYIFILVLYSLESVLREDVIKCNNSFQQGYISDRSGEKIGEYLWSV